MGTEKVLVHSKPYCLETRKKELNRKGYGGTVLMDLSNAFDTINYDLLLAKLHAYGFTNKSLRLIKSYLANCWQRIKVNATFSIRSELILELLQRSVLGPLLFNIYLNDVLYLTQCTNVYSYVEDTTFHACEPD